VIWSKSKPEVELQYGGRLREFNGMSSQSHIPNCTVLPPGEFNVTIPMPRATLQGAAWQIQCHVIQEPCATLQGGRIPSTISKIVVRRILLFMRVSTPTRDIYIAILSVRMSVCLFVRDVPVLDENGSTYCHSFFHHTVAESF